MKKLIFVMVSFCFVYYNSQAQTSNLAPITSKAAVVKPDTLLTVDKSNPKLKHFLIKKNELPLEQGDLLNDKKEGLWKMYYETGTPRSIMEYHNGIVNGMVMTFDHSGFVMKEEHYLDGKLDGISINYHNGGKIKSYAYYTAGLLNGKKVANYDDGTRQEESNWSMGKKNGTTKWFYQGGKTLGEYNYINDVNNGKCILYDAKGNVIKSGQFVNGKEDGEWLFSAEKYGSEPYKKLVYKDGVVVSETWLNQTAEAEEKKK